MKRPGTIILLSGLVLLTCWGMSGCLKLSKEFPERTYYALEVPRPGPDPAAEAGTILKVRKFRVLPRYEGKGLVYWTGEHQYESDYYRQWFVAPNAMVTQQVQGWVAASGLFEHVLASASTAEETHVLEGTVTALYGDYRGRASPKAVLGLQVVLLDERPSHSGIVFQRDYQREVGLPTPAPDALVQGWNEALRQVLAALEEDLRKVTSQATSEKNRAGGKEPGP